MQNWVVQNSSGKYLNSDYYWVDHPDPADKHVHSIEDLAIDRGTWANDATTLTLVEIEGDESATVKGQPVPFDNLYALLRVQMAEEGK